MQQLLNEACQVLDKPLVLLLDEVDSVEDESLLALLRQLREGYVERGRRPFHASVALVGMRNVRDYQTRLRDDDRSLGTASPFNIVAKYLTLEMFSEAEIGELYGQHTAETGQVFTRSAVQRVFYWCGGQPWLVNAIARECVEELCRDDFTRTIDVEEVDAAVHAIVRRRDVHIDSLLARLREPRVQRILQPVILGTPGGLARMTNADFDDDLSCVTDLGLLRREADSGRLEPANRIYAEVFLRVLSLGFQEDAADAIRQPPWLLPDGLDMNGLLRAFQEFWRENSEMYTTQTQDYREALPHLVLMGFLQRVVNGGGRVLREYALGKGRLDLLVQFRNGRYPIELKILGNESPTSARQQLEQYLDRCGCREVWLVRFDRSTTRPWSEKLTWQTIADNGYLIHLVGC